MKAFFNIFLLLFFLILTVLFNIGLIDVRFQEINYLLGKAAFDQDASNALGIVAKYELIRRRMEAGEASPENYELEARIQALISGDRFSEEEELSKKKKYLIPVRIFLNSIRFALGKEFVNLQEENKIIKVLEIGYFWERNRKYSEAIKIYKEVLDMPDLDHDVRSAVLIHKAFCHSMMSEYKKSKEMYERVINLYPNTEAGILSWKLLGFLEKMEVKRQKVKRTKLTHFDKAKQYYLVMDYRNSIKYFSKFLQENKKGRRIAEARFFKGRSHEEIGETEEAVEEYRRIIKIDRTKKWAKEANRRMLMLGEFYDYKKKMAEEAKKQLSNYQDGSFLNRVDKFKNLWSASSIKEELQKSGDKEKTIEEVVDRDIMNLIDSIGQLDLTGEVEKKKALEKRIEKLIAKGVKSEVEIREFKRKIALTDNPFRRPSFIKRTIDANTNQLKYLYNRRLRKGEELSGKMIIEMNIKPDGYISSTKIVNSNIGDQRFEKEVLAKVESWKFRPVPDSLGIMRIKYPFEFYEEK